MRKRFGIDIDGTVTCPSSMIPYLNKDFGLNLTLEDIKEYDLTNVIPISEDDFSKWWLDHEADIYIHSPLVLGVRNVLLEWAKHFDLFYISARNTHLLQITKNWFIQNGLPYTEIELIGTHNKVKTVKKYRLDIFFEDNYDNAVMIHEHCRIPVILFNMPYNQKPLPDGVIRVNNWTEAKLWVENWLRNQTPGISERGY